MSMLRQPLATLLRTATAVPRRALSSSAVVPSPFRSLLRPSSLAHAFSSLRLSARPSLVVAAPAAGQGLGGSRSIYLPKGARKAKSPLARGKKTARAAGKRKVSRARCGAARIELT